MAGCIRRRPVGNIWPSRKLGGREAANEVRTAAMGGPALQTVKKSPIGGMTRIGRSSLKTTGFGN